MRRRDALTCCTVSANYTRRPVPGQHSNMDGLTASEGKDGMWVMETRVRTSLLKTILQGENRYSRGN